MSRFARIDGEAVYSEIRPERCPLHVMLGDRAQAEARRAFMQDNPAAEVEYRGGDDALYSQSRRRSR